MPPVAYILKHCWSCLQVFPIWTKWLKFENFGQHTAYYYKTIIITTLSGRFILVLFSTPALDQGPMNSSLSFCLSICLFVCQWHTLSRTLFSFFRYYAYINAEKQLKSDRHRHSAGTPPPPTKQKGGGGCWRGFTDIAGRGKSPWLDFVGKFIFSLKWAILVQNRPKQGFLDFLENFVITFSRI